MQRQIQPAAMRADTHIQTGIDNAAARVWTEIISAISLVLPPNSLANAKLDVAVGAATGEGHRSKPGDPAQGLPPQAET